MPTIKEALLEYMKGRGYTSLCNLNLNCGCGNDDLIPCEYPNLDECKLGYTKICDFTTCDNINCENREYHYSDVCYTLNQNHVKNDK